GVAGFRLCHHEGVPLPGEAAQVIRLRARDVDRALPREPFVVEVEDLVVEALQGAFGDGYEPHRQVHAGQPRRRLDQMRDVLQVHRDLTAVTDAAHGGDQAYGLIGLDHGYSLFGGGAAASGRPAHPVPPPCCTWRRRSVRTLWPSRRVSWRLSMGTPNAPGSSRPRGDAPPLMPGARRPRSRRRRGGPAGGTHPGGAQKATPRAAPARRCRRSPAPGGGGWGACRTPRAAPPPV